MGLNAGPTVIARVIDMFQKISGCQKRNLSKQVIRLHLLVYKSSMHIRITLYK